MTSRLSVAFRVDESAQTGRGHMSRCSALAGALQDAGAQVSFYCQDVSTDTKSALQSRGICVVELLDEGAFLDRDWSGEIVVVDGYQFGEDFWQRLLAAHPRRTVFIDDFRRVRYVADLLICCNDGLEVTQFNLAPATRLLLGGRYLLLRPEILQAARSASLPTPRRAVMLAVGGTRQEQWVINILTHLSIVDPRATLWVLSGRPLPVGKVLRRVGLSPGRVRFFSGLEPDEMLRLYRRARYLVAPASTVMLEAFTVGCPIISGWIADNQRNSLDFYHRQGLVLNMGDLRRIRLSCLVRARSSLRLKGHSMMRSQRSYIAASRTGIIEIVKAVLSINDGVEHSIQPTFPDQSATD